MTLFSCSLFIKSNHKLEQILFLGTLKVFQLSSRNFEVHSIQEKSLFVAKKTSKKAETIMELEKLYLSKIYNKNYQITIQLQPACQKILQQKKYKSSI
jgi:hypothetical protein